MYEIKPLGACTIDELRAIDRTGLSADERLDLCLFAQQLADAADAVALELKAEFKAAYDDEFNARAFQELALAAQISPEQAARDLAEADDFDSVLQPVREAMVNGLVTARHARAIRRALSSALSPVSLGDPDADATNAASRAAAESVVARAVEYAKTHTANETSKTVRRWLKVIDPVSAQQRHERELARRGVYFTTTDDGLGMLTIEGDPLYLYLIYLCICAAGDYDKAHAEEGDTRTKANCRADAAIAVLYDATRPRETNGIEEQLASVFEQLARGQARSALLGVPLLPTRKAEDLSPWHVNRSKKLQRIIYGAVDDSDPPSSDPDDPCSELTDAATRGVEWGPSVRGRLRRTGVSPIRVNLVIDEATLAERADNPVMVDDTFELTAPAARRLLASADFQRLVVGAIDGSLLDRSPEIYEPNRELREFVETQFMTCSVKGCGKPAHRSQLDHVEPFNHKDPSRGGKTVKKNLGPLCCTHHDCKTHRGYDIVFIDKARDKRGWKTPLGRVYSIEYCDLRPGHLPSV